MYDILGFYSSLTASFHIPFSSKPLLPNFSSQMNSSLNKMIPPLVATVNNQQLLRKCGASWCFLGSGCFQDMCPVLDSSPLSMVGCLRHSLVQVSLAVCLLLISTAE